MLGVTSTDVNRLLIAVLTIVTLAGLSASAKMSVATGATGWRIVKQASSDGKPIPKIVSAIVDNPKQRGIAVRFKGKTTQRMASISCLDGTFLYSERTKSYSHNGLFVLPMAPGVDSCFVRGAIDGWGSATVQILRR
jgi:hypothetical protein